MISDGHVFASSLDLSLEKIKIPGQSAEGRVYELNGILVKPKKHLSPLPLVVITHGAPVDPSEAKDFNIETEMPQATVIGNFGYAAFILERRGFGNSSEPVTEFAGTCSHRDYKKSVLATDSDLSSALRYFSKISDIDPRKMAVMGHSAGGFCAVELARLQPVSLKGVISFAGFRGSDGHGSICDLNKFESLLSEAGKTSRIPELWIFSQNDHVFPLDLAKEIFKIFTQAGGKAEFWSAPSFGEDGHNLFSERGIPIWKTRVESFLNSIFK